MTFERTPTEWEVDLQGPDGKTITEKIKSYWSPSFDGVKESIAVAARCQAWIRNKKKIQFVVVGEAKQVTDG